MYLTSRCVMFTLPSESSSQVTSTSITIFGIGVMVVCAVDSVELLCNQIPDENDRCIGHIFGR